MSFYQQMEQLHANFRIFGSDMFESDFVAKGSGPKIAEAPFAAGYTDPSFTERFRKEFGNTNQAPFAASAYAFALMAGKVLSSKESLTPTEIMDGFRNIGVQQTAVGELRYSETPYGPGFNIPVVEKRIAPDGSVRVIER